MMNHRAEEYTHGWVASGSVGLDRRIQLRVYDALPLIDSAKNTRMAYVKITAPIGKNEAFEVLWEVDTKEILREYSINAVAAMLGREGIQGRKFKPEMARAFNAMTSKKKLSAKKLADIRDDAKMARGDYIQDDNPPTLARWTDCQVRSVDAMASKECEDAVIFLTELSNRGIVGRIVFAYCWHESYCRAITWANRNPSKTPEEIAFYIDQIANEVWEKENRELAALFLNKQEATK